MTQISTFVPGQEARDYGIKLAPLANAGLFRFLLPLAQARLPVTDRFYKQSRIDT